MSLQIATPIDSTLPSLPAGPPYSCVDLGQWKGISFWMKPTDPRLVDIHNGQPAPTPPLENLEGMVYYWMKHPDWMNLMDPTSPVHVDKMLERELYIDVWKSYVSPTAKILDIGGGVGRLTQWLLNQHCQVQVIDPDLRSLWQLVSLAAGGPGHIDVHWSTAEKMPLLGTFDVVMACEVLNYVEDPAVVVQRVLDTLKPKGILLLSVEARWGWALANDVSPGSLDSFLHSGIVHVPHDRWIKTYAEEELRQLLAPFDLLKIQPSHYTLSGPFENIVGRPDKSTLLSIEHQLRRHPVTKHLNRAWIVVAQKP